MRPSGTFMSPLRGFSERASVSSQGLTPPGYTMPPLRG